MVKAALRVAKAVFGSMLGDLIAGCGYDAGDLPTQQHAGASCRIVAIRQGSVQASGFWQATQVASSHPGRW